MGKYIIYGVVIFIIVFILNWFKIIDIPFLDVPDITQQKQHAVSKSTDLLKKMD